MPRSPDNHSAGSPLFPPGFSLRDEANAIVAMAFRNGPLENLHSGKHSPLLDDLSLSRITDAEMKELMISACERVEKLLRWKTDDPEEYSRQILFFSKNYCAGWER